MRQKFQFNEVLRGLTVLVKLQLFTYDMLADRGPRFLAIRPVSSLSDYSHCAILWQRNRCISKKNLYLELLEVQKKPLRRVIIFRKLY